MLKDAFKNSCSISVLVNGFNLGVTPIREKNLRTWFSTGASLMHGVADIINPPGFNS